VWGDSEPRQKEDEGLIDRDNCHDILAYLAYGREVRQNAKGTLDLRWNQLRHLLEWADATPFRDASRGIRDFADQGSGPGRTRSSSGPSGACIP